MTRTSLPLLRNPVDQELVARAIYSTRVSYFTREERRWLRVLLTQLTGHTAPDGRL